MQGFFVFYLIFIFSISYLTCIYLIPYVCQIGLQFNVLDKKEERKLNFNNQVRLGGLSIIIPFYLSIFLSYLTNIFNYELLNLDLLQTRSQHFSNKKSFLFANKALGRIYHLLSTPIISL